MHILMILILNETEAATLRAQRARLIARAGVQMTRSPFSNARANASGLSSCANCCALRGGLLGGGILGGINATGADAAISLTWCGGAARLFPQRNRLGGGT